MSAGQPPIDALADGLWRRLRDVALAEQRLERFAFATEPSDAGPSGRLAALAGNDAALLDLARDLTLRALGAVADGVNYRLLAALGDEPVATDRLARVLGLPALAVSERVNGLAQLGLATRQFEHDAAAETEAGRAMVALIESIAARLAARGRDGLPSLP